MGGRRKDGVRLSGVNAACAKFIAREEVEAAPALERETTRTSTELTYVPEIGVEETPKGSLKMKSDEYDVAQAAVEKAFTDWLVSDQEPFAEWSAAKQRPEDEFCDCDLLDLLELDEPSMRLSMPDSFFSDDIFLPWPTSESKPRRRRRSSAELSSWLASIVTSEQHGRDPMSD